jgi:broad specificity phosphatase PhoE
VRGWRTGRGGFVRARGLTLMVRRIVLVRHAQASFGSPDYDRLCPGGEEQARLLGEHWASRGTAFARAWSGTCVRHVQTAHCVANAYRQAGRAFPEVVVMSEFDEYPGVAMYRAGLPRLLEECEEARRLHQAIENSADQAEQRRWFQQLFEQVISKWVTGELVVDGVEQWQEFCARVDRGLAKIADDGASAGDAVVFTSGGPIGVAMRRAMNLSDMDTLQMTRMSRNASFSEFVSSGDRFTLSAFNAHPHLNDDSLLTYW